MARYEHLPIYKAALDLTVHLEKLVAGFSRHHKYRQGTEMREGSRAVLMRVLKANNPATANRRRDALLVLQEMVDALLLTLRVAKKVRAFKSFTGYLFVVEWWAICARPSNTANGCWCTLTPPARGSVLSQRQHISAVCRMRTSSRRAKAIANFVPRRQSIASRPGCYELPNLVKPCNS